MQFSHSAIDKYRTCPRLYFLHYIERLRPIIQKSPLFFGSLVDDVVGRIFLEKKVYLTPEELDLSLKSTDDIIQETLAKWYEDEKLRFSQADLDLSLFSEADLAQCIARCKELNLDVSEDSYKAFLDACKTQLKQDDFALDSECQLGYNSFFIKSLELKIGMFLPVVRKWFEGEVQETKSVQREVTLEDEDDVITGYIDMILIMKDGTEMVWDLKTSSRAYKENDANESPQLTIYSEYARIPEVGFLVLQKNIRKREPRVRLQDIRGKITEEQSEKVFSEITEIVDEIKSLDKEMSCFKKNLDSCGAWGGCQYRKFCKFGTEVGLERKEKK